MEIDENDDYPEMENKSKPNKYEDTPTKTQTYQNSQIEQMVCIKPI